MKKRLFALLLLFPFIAFAQKKIRPSFLLKQFQL